MLRSPALADDYTGAWLDEVTFVVTIVDARGSLASTDTMGVNSPRSYAATGESAVHVSRVSLRQDETDGDGDGAAGDVGHAAGTLLVTGADRLASLHRAVNLGGSFGMGGDPFAVEAGGEVPGIVHVELVDLQNGALRAAWSSGASLDEAPRATLFPPKQLKRDMRDEVRALLPLLRDEPRSLPSLGRNEERRSFSIASPPARTVRRRAFACSRAAFLRARASRSSARISSFLRPATTASMKRSSMRSRSTE